METRKIALILLATTLGFVDRLQAQAQEPSEFLKHIAQAEHFDYIGVYKQWTDKKQFMIPYFVFRLKNDLPHSTFFIAIPSNITTDLEAYAAVDAALATCVIQNDWDLKHPEQKDF